MAKDFDGFTVFVVAAVLGMVVGAVGSYWLVDDLAHELKTQDELKRECIAGNDRACKIYEVDYGR